MGKGLRSAAAAAHGSLFASPYQFAIGYAAVGDCDTALAYLVKSADLRERSSSAWMTSSPSSRSGRTPASSPSSSACT